MISRKTWVRLAVNKEAWKKDPPDPRRWRVFADPDIAPIFVTHVTFSGTATARNMRTETNDVRDERDVVAYIYCFGDLTLENGEAHIALSEPTR